MKRAAAAAAVSEAADLVTPVSERDHVQGRLDAPKQLVEYGDYECPYCGQAYQVVKAVQKELGDDLCFVFRNFPLGNAHPHAEHAAEAAEEAGAQGKFWKMHDLLYEHQGALEDESLKRYAAELDLDPGKIARAVETGTHRGRIRADFLDGVKSGVNGTPCFFINGARYDGPAAVESLLAALR